MTIQKIKFKGNEYLLIAGGAIATEEQYENFQESYAHLFKDGIVRRHQKEIGRKEDIEFLETTKPQDADKFDIEIEDLRIERAKVAKLREALEVFIHEYVRSASSGDWGFWDYEKDYFLVDARKALDEKK